MKTNALLLSYQEGDVDEMRDVLQQVPEELEEVFKVLLSKGNEDMVKTVLMLQLVLFSQRPLELAELFFAVKAGTALTGTDGWSRSSAIDDDIMQKRINHLSRGLVEVRSGRATTVQFIHLSASDFPLRNKRLQTLDPNLEPDPVRASHYRLWALCRSCIDQISMVRTEEAYEQLRHKYSFLGYATTYVFDHAEKVLGEGPFACDDNEVGKWLREEDGWFERWKAFLKATDGDRWHSYMKNNMDAGLLYMSSFHGFLGLVRSILGEGGAEVNAQGGVYGNALQAATFRGHGDIVKVLLKNGADINAQDGLYGNALQAAPFQGYEELVKVLLKERADVNAQGGKYGNALQAASLGEHEDTMRVLLKEGAEASTEPGHEDSLSQATSPGVSQDAIVTTSKEQPISKIIWQHVIPRSTMLWPGLVFAIIGGIVLGLERGRRISFLASEAIRRSGIRSQT